MDEDMPLGLIKGQKPAQEPQMRHGHLAVGVVPHRGRKAVVVERGLEFAAYEAQEHFLVVAHEGHYLGGPAGQVPQGVDNFVALGPSVYVVAQEDQEVVAVGPPVQPRQELFQLVVATVYIPHDEIAAVAHGVLRN